MSPSRKARLTFGSALALLLAGGILVALTITRLVDSAKWVAHTYEVKVALSGVESDLTAISRARGNYIRSNDEKFLSEFQEERGKVASDLANIEELTQDNPIQQDYLDKLRSLESNRIQMLDASIELHRTGTNDASAQLAYTQQFADSSAEVQNLTEQMEDEEQKLLNERYRLSGNLFAALVFVLVGTFALSILLLWLHYRFLSEEVLERERAETKARSSEEAARRLSSRILQLQDEERRRFSRELHDSLGQSLTAAKMIADTLVQQNPQDDRVPQLVNILEASIAETRTISHLLHPPLLDELGLASATTWYVEGFAKRSGVGVALDVSPDLPRLSHASELALFRALQESLTNIHRHSKCLRAEVSLNKLNGEIFLCIKDDGTGIPKETMARFQSSGTHAGVGLAGMRERIREQGGDFTIDSNGSGTVVTVRVPATNGDNSMNRPAAVT